MGGGRIRRDEHRGDGASDLPRLRLCALRRCVKARIIPIDVFCCDVAMGVDVPAVAAEAGQCSHGPGAEREVVPWNPGKRGDPMGDGTNAGRSFVP